VLGSIASGVWVAATLHWNAVGCATRQRTFAGNARCAASRTMADRLRRTGALLRTRRADHRGVCGNDDGLEDSSGRKHYLAASVFA